MANALATEFNLIFNIFFMFIFALRRWKMQKQLPTDHNKIIDSVFRGSLPERRMRLTFFFHDGFVLKIVIVGTRM